MRTVQYSACVLRAQAHGTDPTQDCYGIKMALYLEPTDAATGALRLIPGSHLEPLHSTLQAGRSSVTVSDSRPADEMTALLSEDDGTRVPQYVCATQLGDVVAFDV